MRFIKDILMTFSTQIINVISMILVTVIIARMLGPSGKGAYSLAILVPTLLALVGDLGISIANVYFGSSKRHDWADLASNSLLLALAPGIFLAVAFLVYFSIFQPSFLKDVEPRCLFLAALVIPFNMLTAYFSLILLGQNRIKEFNLVNLVQPGALLVFIFFLLLILKGDVFNAILAWSGASFAATILPVLLVSKTTRITWAFHSSIFKESLNFGVKGYLGNLIQYLNYRLNLIIVAFYLGSTFVGYYSLSQVIAEALWYFPAAVGTIIFARTSRMSTEESNRSTPQICRNTLLITILAALVLFALSKPFIALFFGSAFLPALKPLWILLPGTAAFSISKVLGNEITGRGKPMINTVTAGVSLVVNISLNLLLIPMWGISGAAFASSVSYTVTAIVVLIAFTKISKTSLFDTIVTKPQDLRIYMGVFSKISSRFQSAIVNSRLK